jgi:hypothetical protein
LRPLAGSCPCYKTKGFLRLRPEVAVDVAGSLPTPPTAPDRRDRLPPVAGAGFVVLAAGVLFVAFVSICVSPGISVVGSLDSTGLASWPCVLGLRFDMAALCEAGACGWLTDSQRRAAGPQARAGYSPRWANLL